MSTVFVIAWVVTILGILFYLWWTGHPHLIDRGDGPGNQRAWWNLHSSLHLAGGAIAAFFPAFAKAGWQGVLVGIAISLGAGILVELGQRFPRDKKGGVVEVADLLWDFLGALGGALIGGFLGYLVW